jgi:alkylation response protein AidB-like acyl-CoA dehydrogenase
VLIGALYTGVATAARDWLVGHLNARAPSNLGAPLSTLPRVQEATGRIEALLGAGARLIRSAAEDTDAGWPPGGAESMTLRTTLAGDAIRAVEIALELTGLPGVSRANPLERHYRDVLCARIHTPQADTAWVAAGRAALAVGR